MQIACLVNPTAGSGAHHRRIDRAVATLRAAGHRVTVISGGSAAESTSLLRRELKAGPEAIVVVGGDGTVSLAAQELAGTDLPMGIIPTGTGNDLATALGTGGIDAAVTAVLGGRTRTIDLARAASADGGRLFATVLASGFDAKVNDRANAMRWPRGPLRYTIALLIEFVRLRASMIDVELELPDGTHRSVPGPFVLAAVGNCPAYGGGIPICPDADPTDGLLDVTLVRSAGRLRLLRLLPRLYHGTHPTVPEVDTWRVSAITLRAATITAYADGDPVGALPIRVASVPAALRVFVPA